MAFRNFSVTSLGAGMYQMDFECTVANSEDTHTNYGQDGNYGFSTDPPGTSLGPTTDGFFAYRTTLDANPIGDPPTFHYQQSVTSRTESEESSDKIKGTPYIDNIITDESTSGQVNISWQAHGVIFGLSEVRVDFGATDSYGDVAFGSYAGGLEPSSYNCVVLQDAPFHFRCVVVTFAQGEIVSTDQFLPGPLPPPPPLPTHPGTGGIFTYSRVNEYSNNTSNSISQTYNTDDLSLANIDSPSGSVGSLAGGVVITEGGTDVTMQTNGSDGPVTINNAGARFMR